MNKFYAFVKNMNDSLFTRFLDIIHINRLPTLLNDLASPLQIKLYMYVFVDIDVQLNQVYIGFRWLRVLNKTFHFMVNFNLFL